MSPSNALAAPASLHGHRAVLRLSAAWTIGILTITLMPIEVAALMARLGWAEGTAGAIAGLQVLGIVAACVLLPRLMPRFTSRSMAVVIGVLAISQVGTAFATSAELIGTLRLVVGLCEGSMIVAVGACMASQHNSEILWGKVILISGVFAAGMLTGLAYLPDALQQRGVWIGLGASEVVLGVATLKLPSMRRVLSTVTVRPRLSGAVLSVWLVTAAVYLVQQGQWAVAGLHAAHRGLSTGQSGLLLALSSLLGFAGCVLTSLPPLRAHRVLAASVCVAGMACCVVWFFGASGAHDFFVSQLVLNLAFNGLSPLVNAVITERDTDGSLISRSVVVAFAAASLGTMGSAALLELLGPNRFGDVGAFILLCALPAVAVGLRRTQDARVADQAPVQPRCR